MKNTGPHLKTSGRQDLNLRPLDPQSSALARLRHAPNCRHRSAPECRQTPTSRLSQKPARASTSARRGPQGGRIPCHRLTLARVTPRLLAADRPVAHTAPREFQIRPSDSSRSPGSRPVAGEAARAPSALRTGLLSERVRIMPQSASHLGSRRHLSETPMPSSTPLTRALHLASTSSSSTRTA